MAINAKNNTLKIVHIFSARKKSRLLFHVEMKIKLNAVKKDQQLFTKVDVKQY